MTFSVVFIFFLELGFQKVLQNLKLPKLKLSEVKVISGFANLAIKFDRSNVFSLRGMRYNVFQYFFPNFPDNLALKNSKN